MLLSVVKWSRSVVSDSATPWTVAHQASTSMGFSRQEYWSGVPLPSPGDLPDPGIEPGSPALWADASPSEPPGKSTVRVREVNKLGKRLRAWVSMCVCVWWDITWKWLGRWHLSPELQGWAMKVTRDAGTGNGIWVRTEALRKGVLADQEQPRDPWLEPCLKERKKWSEMWKGWGGWWKGLIRNLALADVRRGWQRMRWHHRFDGYKCEQDPGVGDGQVMDREAWHAAVHGAVKNWTELNWCESH